MMLYKIFDKGIDWNNDTIKVILVDDTYVFSMNDEYLDDVSAKEVSGTNYSRQTLGSKTSTYTEADRTQRFDAANATFSNITVSNVGGAIVFMDSGTASTSPLIAHFAGSGSPVADDVQLNWSPNGIYSVRYE